MVEHCPDWAKEIYMNYGNHYFDFLTKDKIKNEDYQTTECMVSQLVAEWLELDQLKWYKRCGKDIWLDEKWMNGEGKIKFFQEDWY